MLMYIQYIHRSSSIILGNVKQRVEDKTATTHLTSYNTAKK